MARIDALTHFNAGILPDFPVELTLTDIDACDMSCAVLKKTISKTTRGRTEIETIKTGRVQLKCFETGFKFVTTTADVLIRAAPLNLRFGWAGMAGFVDTVTFDPNFSCHNSGLGFLPGFKDS